MPFEGVKTKISSTIFDVESGKKFSLENNIMFYNIRELKMQSITF